LPLFHSGALRAPCGRAARGPRRGVCAACARRRQAPRLLFSSGAVYLSTAFNGSSSVTRYKVIQWATGAVGVHALRALIEDPDFELVGLYVHDAEKIGRAAGECA